MLLFIANEPFSEELDVSDPAIRRVDIRLLMAITEPDASAPSQTPLLFEFVLDTASDYANVFPHNLLDGGMSPGAMQSGVVPVILMDGSMIERPMRDVSLWLYSNVPGLTTQPYRIDPSGGAVVLPDPSPDVAPLVRPLLGMNPLLDAGLQIELDAQARRFSVWVPD